MSEHQSFRLTRTKNSQNLLLRRSRAYNVTLWLVFLTIIAILVVPTFGQYLYAWISQRNEAKQARIELANCRTPQEFEEACGELGIFVSIGDDEWIAIRYRDWHGFPIWSYATALDSDGNWWTSTHHHCGRFAAYKMFSSEAKNETDLEVREVLKFQLESFPNLRAMASADSLAKAVPYLQSLDFQKDVR